MIAAKGLVSIGSDNYFNKAEAKTIGIYIEAQEMEVSYASLLPPVIFTVNLDYITARQVTNVCMNILDSFIKCQLK